MIKVAICKPFKFADCGVASNHSRERLQIFQLEILGFEFVNSKFRVCELEILSL